MQHLRSLSLLMLLLTVALSAAAEPAGFRIEVLVHKRASGPFTIPVRCLNGCAWKATTIDCPVEGNECRAIVDGRSGVEPYVDESSGSDQVRPLSGTVCLGLAPGLSQPAEAKGLTGIPAGVLIMSVATGSPAEIAGFKEGDLLTSFNAVPIQQGKELREVLPSLVAGELFKATIYRAGTLVPISGSLGIWTTADTCLPADPELLARPAVMPRDPKPTTRFTLAFDDIGSAELRCLTGCPWETSTPCKQTQRCTFQIDENGDAQGSATEAAP